MNEDLGMWVVYERPSDHPDGFIARLFELHSGGAHPTEETVHGATLDDVRAQLPPGLYCLPRAPNDEPQIVEVWL